MRSLILILLMASVTLAGNWEKEFTFSENDLTIEQLDSFAYIRMAGFRYGSEPGSPLLPYYSVSVLIPPTAEITDVSIIEYDKDSITSEYLQYPVYPAQPAVPIGETTAFVPPNDSIYSLDTEYPTERALGIRTGCKAGYRIAGLFLYPISYIPKEKKLYLYTRLKVRIEYDEGKYQQPYLTLSQKELFSQDVEKLIINPEDIGQYAPSTHQVENPEIDYIIITSSALTDSFLPLVNWLRKTGIWADTISTTYIDNHYSYRDLQEKIRYFIKDYYDNHGLKYVLLGGDVSIVPSRKTWLYLSEDTCEFVPCDLYYADLQYSWDGNHNDSFGEFGNSGVFDTVDLLYDLNIGRASVENDGEVSNFIRKLFIYEKTPDTLYQKRILLPWGKLWSGYDASQSQDSIVNYLPTDWSDTLILNHLIGDMDTVKHAIDHGFGFCHFVGHGSWCEIDWDISPQVYMYSSYSDPGDPASQTNDSQLVVANAISCHPGAFTYSIDCLAEKMMNAKACAVAVIMNSGYGWGGLDHIDGSELLDVRFYDFLFQDSASIAVIHQRSKESYFGDAYYLWWWRWCYDGLNLLGEPSMPLWTDNPRTMVADFPDSIYTGSQDFTVSVTSDGFPVSNALVCLWKGNEVYDKSRTNTSGQASFIISPTTHGYMYVTVTARNKLPFEDSCYVNTSIIDRRLRVEVRHYQNGGVTINRVATVTYPYICVWAVGDNGQVFKLSQTGEVMQNYPITLNAEYNLTGVSFANAQVGYIVGYKRDGADKWKGAVWKTTTGGGSGSWSVQYPTVVTGLNVPFLDVHAVNANVAWISCGHGYVLVTYDAGLHWSPTPQKPGGPNHFGWLWGIDAPDENTVWVCSDQSGLIAMTTDGGDSWTTYEPAESDSLVYFDIDYHNDTAVVAASKGYLLSYESGSWHKYSLFDSTQTTQSLYGAFNLEQKWGVGSGGIIGSQDGDSSRKYWYSKKYDLRDIDGFKYSSEPLDNRYFMVGTNATILFGREVDSSGINGFEEPLSIPEMDTGWAFNIVDDFQDHGWNVNCNWGDITGEDSFRVYSYPKCDTNLYGNTGFGYPCWIASKDRGSMTCSYDSALTGQNIKYAVVAHLKSGETKATFATGTANDEIAPPQVTGLQGRYNDAVDAVEIWWNPMPQTGDTAYPETYEPNLAGYWVCPETIGGEKYNINHPCPISRNYYIEKVPDWVRGHYWGFWVRAMDRSGNQGDWSDSVLVWIPNNPSNSPYATAFNQGRHLVRIPNDTFHFVYSNNGKIFYSYSINMGVTWSREELENGYFPSIAIDQKNYRWITFWQDGDIICIVKNDQGYSKDTVIFDCGDTCWAGPPAIAVHPGQQPFAYITYPVYVSEAVPNIPLGPPVECNYSCIKLSVLDTIDIAHYIIDEEEENKPVCFPSLAVTPGDYLQLVWQRDGEIWYRTNNGKILPQNWKNITFQDKLNISSSSTVLSQHPFIESYGDYIYAAWREGEDTLPGEIYRRKKMRTSPYWDATIVNISQSPNDESDYPVLATSDVVAYQEKVEGTNYEIYAWIHGDSTDTIVNISETDNPSKFPHVVVEPPGQSEPEKIDAIWTEAVIPDSLYEVKFNQYDPSQEEMKFFGMMEYISVSVGDTEASPYCEQRNGYIDYGEFACDYANSSLIYNIPYLNPSSNYLLRAVAYKEGSQSGKEEVYVDTTLVTEVTYQPNIPETVYALLPKETYENDFEVGKEIEKILGNYALLADLKIYEVSLPDTATMGGAQGNSTNIKRFVLYQNHPNPFKDLTRIAFAIPRECKVSLFVYNVTGRRVRTLIDDKMKPGEYNLKWDGRDNHNRKLSNGIYFYRLQTDDFKDTKKTILLK
jgi:photosystem II stability/assembly factor-like uncharacterized protein